MSWSIEGECGGVDEAVMDSVSSILAGVWSGGTFERAGLYVALLRDVGVERLELTVVFVGGRAVLAAVRASRVCREVLLSRTFEYADPAFPDNLVECVAGFNEGVIGGF